MQQDFATAHDLPATDGGLFPWAGRALGATLQPFWIATSISLGQIGTCSSSDLMPMLKESAVRVKMEQRSSAAAIVWSWAGWPRHCSRGLWSEVVFGSGLAVP